MESFVLCVRFGEAVRKGVVLSRFLELTENYMINWQMNVTKCEWMALDLMIFAKACIPFT